MEAASCSASPYSYGAAGPWQQAHAAPHPFAGSGGSPLFAATGAAPYSGRAPRPPPRTLSEDEAGEIAYAFERLTADADTADDAEPLVTPRQLKLALRALGFPVKKADVRALLRDAGLPADAPLGRADFADVLGAQLLSRPPREDAARAFALFDVRGAGAISANDLRAVAKQLGVDAAYEELKDMVAEFDRDGDGLISAAEFGAILAALDE